MKSSKKNTKLFVNNGEWPDISEEELKYFLEEYGKVNIIKLEEIDTWRGMKLQFVTGQQKRQRKLQQI